MQANKKYTFYLGNERIWGCDSKTEEEAWNMFAQTKQLKVSFLKSQYKLVKRNYDNVTGIDN